MDHARLGRGQRSGGSVQAQRITPPCGHRAIRLSRFSAAANGITLDDQAIGHVTECLTRLRPLRYFALMTQRWVGLFRETWVNTRPILPAEIFLYRTSRLAVRKVYKMATYNRLLQMLPEEDRVALSRHLNVVPLNQGDVLAEPGDNISNVHFPHSGIISFMVALDDGALVQTFMVGQDGVVGASQALDDRTSINKILVQVSGEGSVISRTPLREIAENYPAVRNLLAAHEQFLVADVQQTAACNARHSIEARMARWILRMRDLVGDELPLTQDYLASMIGVRRASVTEIATAMQRDGSISYARGRLRIEDPIALERLSCECHKVVQDNYLRLVGTPWPQLAD